MTTTYITDYFKPAATVHEHDHAREFTHGTKFNIVTLNCQTLEDGHRLRVMLTQFSKHRIDIAIIQALAGISRLASTCVGTWCIILASSTAWHINNQ